MCTGSGQIQWSDKSSRNRFCGNITNVEILSNSDDAHSLTVPKAVIGRLLGKPRQAWTPFLVLHTLAAVLSCRKYFQAQAN